MANPLSAFKNALLRTPEPSNIRVGGKDIEFTRMPSVGPEGTPGPLRPSQADDRIREALDSEAVNQEVFDRMEEAFPDDPELDIPRDPEVLENAAIQWGEDPVAREIVGRTSPALLDAEAYGVENAPFIRRELERRAKGARMMDQSMPQFFPDSNEPLRAYDRDILIVNDGSRLANSADDLGASPGAYAPGPQQMILKYDEATPSVVRHEGSHAAVEGAGLGDDQKSLTNWLSAGSEAHPHQLSNAHARYLTDPHEMKPYLRDLKYQFYYGLADGSVKPLKKRPFFANLLDQTNAEGMDFHRLMDETELGTATDVDMANMTLPALREWAAESYMKMTPEHQRRLQMLWAMLAGAPVVMAEGEGDGSN